MADSIKKRDTPESAAYWDFVEQTAASVKRAKELGSFAAVYREEGRNEVEQEINRLRQQLAQARNLAEAIVAKAVSIGITNGTMPLNGPQVLLLLDNLLESSTRAAFEAGWKARDEAARVRRSEIGDALFGGPSVVEQLFQQHLASSGEEE